VACLGYGWGASFILVCVSANWRDLLTVSVFKENRAKHGSKLKATTQTAKDGGQAVFMGVVIVVGLLICFWIVNGAQNGVGQP